MLNLPDVSSPTADSYVVPVWSGGSGADRWVQLRCYGSVTPGEELVQTCDLMVCDLGKDPCEPVVGIDTVELGGLNEGIGDGRGLTTTFGANEQVILRPKATGRIDLSAELLSIASEPLFRLSDVSAYRKDLGV